MSQVYTGLLVVYGFQEKEQKNQKKLKPVKTKKKTDKKAQTSAQVRCESGNKKPHQKFKSIHR
jgi:hypothetical protein